MPSPKPKDDTRGRQISYRLKEAEYMPLQAIAERAGVSVNELARRLAIQTKIELPPFPGFRPDPAVVLRLDGLGLTLRKIEKNCQPLAADLTDELAKAVVEIRAFIEAAVEERTKE